jgi:hypothetical protein
MREEVIYLDLELGVVFPGNWPDYVAAYKHA